MKKAFFLWLALLLLMPTALLAQIVYSCDFENPTENSQWTVVGTEGNYWFVGTAANHTPNGASALYITNDSGVSYSYSSNQASSSLAYRDIDFGTIYGEYNLSFRVKVGGELLYGVMYDKLDVYLGPAGTTPTSTGAPEGATLLGTYVNVVDWTEISISLSGSFSGNQRLYFRWENDNSGGSNPPAAIDDIVITGNTCGAPRNLTANVNGVTASSIAFHFTPAVATDNAWEATIVAPGDSIDETQVVSLTDTNHTFTNLQGNTLYRIFVRTNCGTENSSWSDAFEVRTECAPLLNPVPFTEGFEGMQHNSAPNCWFVNNNAYVSYFFASEGVNSLRLYSSSADFAVAASPQLNLTDFAENSLYFTFKAFIEAVSYGRLDVGVMTDPNDLTTFTPLKSIYASDYAAESTWCEFTVPLTSAYGNVHLAFVAPAGLLSYVNIDEISLNYIPECMAPSNVMVERIAGTSAWVSWNAAPFNVTDYKVEFTETGTQNWMVAETAVEGTSCFISGLTSQTTYDVRVTSNCLSVDTLSAVATFTTGCLAGGDLAIGNGTNQTSEVPANAYYKYALSQQLFTADEIGGNTTIRGIRFNIVTPVSSVRSWDIYLGNTDQTSHSAYIPVTNHTKVFTGSVSVENAGWVEIVFDSAFAYTGGGLLLTVNDHTAVWASSAKFSAHPGVSFYNRNDSQAYNPMDASTFTFSCQYRNNVVFLADCDSTQTCAAPNLLVTDVTAQSVTIDWAPGNDEVSWELEYKATADTVWTSAGTVSAHPYVLDYLNVDTEYKIRLRSECGSEYSDWAVVSAQTTCDYIVELPYIQNFDAASGEFISCWYRGSNNSYGNFPQISNYHSTSPSNSLQFYASASYCYAATPRFDDAIEMSTLQVSFQLRGNDVNSYIEVGVMTDPTDYNSFELIETVNASYEVYEMVDVDLDGYTGDGHHVAFRVPQWHYVDLNIDDVNIHEIPVCDRVDDIVATQVTPTSATISWAPRGTETSWEILYAPAGTIDYDNMVAESVSSVPSFDLVGLTANSSYDVAVRAVCDNGDYSAWTVGNFRTGCAAITALPYSEGFENLAIGSGNPIYCWTRNTIFDVGYPFVSEANSFSGEKSLYFNAADYSNYNLISMPELDSSIAVNAVEVAFQMRSSSLNNKMIVGVMTNPADINTFVSVDTVTVSEYGVWEFSSISLASYTGTGAYIAFKSEHDYYADIYVDDITLDYIPTCERPSHVQAVSTTTDTVKLSWTANSGSMWDIIYGPTGFDVENSDASVLIPGVDTTAYSVSGLTAGVIYDFYVRTDCGEGDVSPWSYFPASGAPYVYVMNTALDTIYSCGITIADNGGLDGNYSDDSENVLVIYPDQDNYLISISGTISTEETYYSPYDYLEIYEGASATGTPLQRVYSSSADVPVEFGPIVSEAGPLTLKFHSDSYTNSDGFAIVATCVPAPTCRKVANISVAAASANSISLQWDVLDSAYTGFNVAVSTESVFDPDTCTLVFTTSSQEVMLDGLTSNTAYYVMVQTDCGAGELSEWSDVFSCITSTNAATLPYFSDFSSMSEIAEWLLFNGNQQNKWYIGNPSDVTTPGLYISNNNGVSNSYSMTSSSTTWACRDIQFDNSVEFELSFNWKAVGETNYDYMLVYIGNPTVPTNTTTLPADFVQITPRLQDNGTGATFSYAFDASYANTTKRLYFMWRNDGYGGANPPAWVDSIQIVGLNCGSPHHLRDNGITQSTAQIVFTPASASDVAWEYVYGPAGCNPDSITPIALADTVIMLSGLAHSTPYDIYVRTVCAGGEYSGWSNLFTFFTSCEVISTLPYTENFDSYGTGFDVYPLCWHKLNSHSSYPAVMATYSHSSPGALYFYSYLSGAYGMAITPEIDTDILPINSLQVSFWYSSEAISPSLIVGVISDPEDVSTFVPVDTITGQTANWSEHVVYFASYTGTARHIAFMIPTEQYTNYGSIDDVTINFAPNCLAVTNVSASDITQTSATISWTDMSNASSWNIEYGPAGFTLGQGTVVSGVGNPCTLSSLVAATTYDVYVQANCTATDISEWSAVYSFTTDCDLINQLPYTENFDTYQGTTYEVEGAMPTCWFSYTDNTAKPAPHIIGSGSYYYPSSQPNALAFTGSSPSTNAYAVLPEFAAPLNTLQLMFNYQMEDSYFGILIVGYVTDITNLASSFVAVDTVTSSMSAAIDTVDFSAISATEGRITFVWEYVGSSFYTCNIDDVVVTSGTVAEPCDAPTNVQVTPAETSATVTWTSTASAWVVEYKETSASNWTASSTLTANTYSITGLTAATDYVVRVKAICDADESAWSAEIPFSTLAGGVTSYTITATATGPGSITPNGTVTVQEGSDITFNFTPDAGAEVSSLLVDDVETAIPADNSYTFSAVVANHTIAVAFEEDETGIEELDLDAAVVLYPNPATSHILINVADARFLGAEMQIFDAYGKLIANTTVETLSTQVDVSQLANGMYMVRISANDGMVTKRFVKR